MAREDFDYGVDPALVGGCNIRKWEKDGKLVGLVDADAIPYIVGYTTDELKYLQAQRSGDFYNHKWWKDACDHANFILNKWLLQAGCDAALLYVTDSSSNFRLNIGKQKQYKGQRVSEKPPFFAELKQWLIDFHDAKLSDGCEADDDISIEAHKRIIQLKADGCELWGEDHKRWSNFVILSKDKDLNIIPSWHCDVDTGEKYWVDQLGWLTPIFKEKEKTQYEYHPLFNGKPVPISKCCYFGRDSAGYIKPFPYNDHPKVVDDYTAAIDEIWYYAEKGMPVSQDVYARGKNKGNGKFKRVNMGKQKVEVLHRLKGAGLKFFYAQLLMGDSTDNYGGLEGCGVVGTYEALNNLSTERDLFDKVLSMYRAKYRHLAEEYMLEMGQLAWMQTKEKELWQFPFALNNPN